MTTINLLTLFKNIKMIIRTKIKSFTTSTLTEEDKAEIETAKIIYGEESADLLREEKTAIKGDFVDAIYDTDRNIIYFNRIDKQENIVVEDPIIGQFSIIGTIDELYKKLKNTSTGFIEMDGIPKVTKE